MFSFNLFLSWRFVQDEDDYSTTIMHPSRNSYTAPAALLNEIAHTAEHVCISCTLIISCWCMWFLVDKVQLYYKHLPFNGLKIRLNSNDNTFGVFVIILLSEHK